MFSDLHLLSLSGIRFLQKASHSSTIHRCSHRWEIQSVLLSQTDCDGCVILGTVDSHGHLFVSRLTTTSQDFGGATYSALPRDSGVGEGSWAGLSFSPSPWSTILEFFENNIYDMHHSAPSQFALKEF